MFIVRIYNTYGQLHMVNRYAIYDDALRRVDLVNTLRHFVAEMDES